MGDRKGPFSGHLHRMVIFRASAEEGRVKWKYFLSFHVFSTDMVFLSTASEKDFLLYQY
jgi:hypothetical protein